MKEKIFIIIILLVLIGVFIMTGIVHKAVKVSGEKGLATEWNDDHEITGNIDVDQNQFLNNVIEQRTDFPAGPVAGQIIFRTDLKATYVFDGTNWSRLNKGVLYWSCPGTNFKGWAQGTQVTAIDYHYGDNWVESDQDTAFFMCPVFLPDGAVVVGAIVYGSVDDETWSLVRAHIGASEELASALFNIEDTTIANAVVDNSNWSYMFLTSSIDDTDKIYWARIIYTL